MRPRPGRRENPARAATAPARGAGPLTWPDQSRRVRRAPGRGSTTRGPGRDPAGPQAPPIGSALRGSAPELEPILTQFLHAPGAAGGPEGDPSYKFAGRRKRGRIPEDEI